MNINKYQGFLLEKEFESILHEMWNIVESTGKWVDERTMEWDLSKPNSDDDSQKREFEWDFTKNKEEFQNPFSPFITKLKNFLSKLTKEKIKEYFVKLIDEVKSLPSSIRRKLIVNFMSVFLLFVSANYLLDTSDESGKKLNLFPTEIKSEINQSVEVKKGASFEQSQQIVKSAEAGYSDDRSDTGNWVAVPGYGQRFVGTNHGISAPILAEYLGRIPKKEDMMNLSYETALEIYKNQYWDAQNLGNLKDQSLANIIYDGCVNQGIGRMDGIISEIFEDEGIEIEGSVFSKRNIEKLNKMNAKKVFNIIKDKRLDRYRQAATWDVHGEGWMNRLDKIQYLG